MLYDQELIDQMLMQGYLQELLSRGPDIAAERLGAGYVEKTSNLVQFSWLATQTINQEIAKTQPDSYPGVFWYEVPGLLFAALMDLLAEDKMLEGTDVGYVMPEHWDELLTKWADVVTVVFRQWLDGEDR